MRRRLPLLGLVAAAAVVLGGGLIGGSRVFSTVVRRVEAWRRRPRVLAGVANGRVILLESVVQPGNVPDFGKLIDMEMLLIPGGRERTADEFASLFARAGFDLTRIVPTASALSVVEAVAR